MLSRGVNAFLCSTDLWIFSILHITENFLTSELSGALMPNFMVTTGGKRTPFSLRKTFRESRFPERKASYL